MPTESPNSRLLLIDDDLELARMLREFLASDRIALTHAASGEDGLEKLGADAFDLLILDIMLPGMDGLEVLRRLRQGNDIPVIMLTARGDDIDRIVGLEVGADDYLSKPFNPRELLARIKAIQRRTQRLPDNHAAQSFESISIDARTRTAAVNDNVMKLTGTEYEVLRALLGTPGEVVSKEHLCEVALGRRLLPYDRSIDTHISNLRAKLEAAGGHKVTIQNQRGVGYLLIPQRTDPA